MRIRPQGPSLTVDAPAKLNLHLNVLGRRADGFHELETVMVSIDCCDTLRLTPDRSCAPGATLSVRCGLRGGGHLPASDDNLVLRAVRKFCSRFTPTEGVRIELFKRIPWQAGLGGGSSDAAATLVALNRLWGEPLRKAELHLLAAELGSDINFFLDSQPLAICRGRGEQIEARPLRRPLHLVVAQPAGPGLSTADVFRHWRPDTASPNASRLLSQLERGAGPLCKLPLYNALEGAAKELHPGVATLLGRLRSCGLSAATLSGSGSACFALAEGARHAKRVARWLNVSTGLHAFAATTIT